MAQQRPAIQRTIDKIHGACGLEAFIKAIVDEIPNAPTVNQLRWKLPFKVSERKLVAFLDEYFPDLTALMAFPAKERKPSMRSYLINRTVDVLVEENELQVAMRLYDPNHTLFKYFTVEWYTKYKLQRHAAGHRNIEWKFDFISWIMWWVQTGHIEERGIGSGYQMCRHGDNGAYSPENCYCATGPENLADAVEFRKAARERQMNVL